MTSMATALRHDWKRRVGKLYGIISRDFFSSIKWAHYKAYDTCVLFII